MEIVNEADGRPPLTLILDQLEHAFGQPYLADFLAVLLRYAPPGRAIGLGTRTPLPVDAEESARHGCRTMTTTDLAMALLLWGEKGAAVRLLHQSLEVVTRVQSKWHMHVVHTGLARLEWADGRAHFDQAVALAAREGYPQYLQTPGVPCH